MIKAEIIADSITEQGHRCTSFVLTMPRIVLAEFNTHRAISRNSASSRAVPFKTMLEKVKTNPFIPIKWMKEHKGMQGTEYFTDEEIAYGEFIEQWLEARDSAVDYAEILSEGIVYSDKLDSGDYPSKETSIGVTKQICNRLLEPFMWHTVIATATEWENFFALRAHEAAEIHIQKLAYVMLEEYNKSQPKFLAPGTWHIPFGEKFDDDRIQLEILDDWNKRFDSSSNIAVDALEEAKIKIASARCARVSYINYEGKDDYVADIKLHDNLANMGHMSPLEHCARAMNDEEYYSYTTHKKECEIPYGWSGNFRGFVQYRKLFENENKKEPRILKKEHHAN